MERILEKMQIDNIISVDDAWDKNQLFHREMESDIWEYIDTKKIELSEAEKDYIYDNNIENLNDLKIKDEKLLEKIYRPIEGNDLSLEILKETFGGKLKSCSSIVRFRDLVTALEKNKLYLFIVDINMDSSSTDFLMELLEIIESKNLKRFIIIIYSNANDIIDKLADIEKRKIYLEEKGKDFKYMTLIHPIKKRIDNKISLKNEIKDNILISYLHSGLYNFLEVKKNLDREIYNNIYSSELYNFLNKTLVTIEAGETMMDLIRRLFLTVHNANSYKNEDFLEVRKNLIMAGNVIKELNEDKIDSKINKHSKYSIIDFSINKYYKDIFTGDLFKFSLKTETDEIIVKYGMIISKSCHLLLRNKGRSLHNKKVSILLLEREDRVEFLSKNNSKMKAWRDQQNSGAAIWPINVEEAEPTPKFDVLVNKCKLLYIDDFILDLCTLNSEGKIILTADGRPKEIEEALKFKSYYSDKYFEKFNIFEKFNNGLKNNILKFSSKNEDNLEPEEKAKLDEILLNELCKENSNIEFKIENNEILLEVERIGRIYEDKALLLFQKYISDVSNRGIEDFL